MILIEEAVRDYLRGVPAVMGLLSNEESRCDIEYSGKNLKAKHLTIYRAGGSMAAYLPHENPIVVIHCFAGSRQPAAELAQTVATAMRNITQADEPLRSCSVESINFVPAADGTARYAVTTVVTSRLV